MPKINEIHPAGLFSTINLTYGCNLCCSWCYVPPIRNAEVMDRDTLGDILSLLKELKVHRVILSGGEPTKRAEDFLAAVKQCRSFGMRVFANTNGLAFADRNFLAEALNSGLSTIHLSLKGVNQIDFRNNTGFNLFDRQKTAVKNILSSNRCSLFANLTLNRYFIKGFGEAIEMVNRWGIKSLTIGVALPAETEFGAADDQIPAPKEVADFVEHRLGAISFGDLDYTFRFTLPLCLFDRSKIGQLLSRSAFVTNCFLREGTDLVFDPQGGLIPCNHLSRQALGYIGRDFSTAAEYHAFLSRDDIAARLNHLRAGPDEDCRSCEWVNRCCRSCPALTSQLAHNSDIHPEK